MKNYLIFIFLGCLLIISCSSQDDTQETSTNIDPVDAPIGMRNITSMQLVADMKPGWNVGNSLDAEGANETVWGNPIVTKDLIDAVKARGFGTLRVPVTWRFHTGDGPEYIIDGAWLARVEEVVNYGLDNDMHVILNIHHDEEWIIPTLEKAPEVKQRLEKTWSQIANHFQQYDEHLIFETLNEPRYENQPEEWTGTPEWRDVVNQYHQVSLDAIRATGGNNTLRHIMISPYAASQVAINDLIIPNNDERTIISIHNYLPFKFALSNEDTTWGTDADKAEMDNAFDQLYNTFISNGKPVVMGEWGASHQDNLEDRLKHAKYYAEGCVARGILPVVWDNGNLAEFGLINRQNLSWRFPDIADAIVNSKLTE